jgi:hypothetical protein
LIPTRLERAHLSENNKLTRRLAEPGAVLTSEGLAKARSVLRSVARREAC